MSSTPPEGLVELGRIEQLERDLGLEQVRAHLAAIPPEHPRWPDGTPAYIGQRVRHQIASKPGTLTSAWTSPDGVLVRYSNHAGWFRLDEMRRLDPEGTTDD